MISHYSSLEQTVSDTSGYQNSFISLAQRMVFNFKRRLRNRRELCELDNEQLRDVGLSREAVERACRLNLLRK